MTFSLKISFFIFSTKYCSDTIQQLICVVAVPKGPLGEGFKAAESCIQNAALPLTGRDHPTSALMTKTESKSGLNAP